MRVAVAASLIVSLSACSSKDGESSSNLQKIIGANNFVSIKGDGSNVDEKYRPLLDAFGNFADGCTATHVGEGIAISAGHCFSEGDVPRETNVACNHLMVFGDRPDRTPLVTNCTTILVREVSTFGDYAVFKLSQTPTASLKVDLTPTATGKTVTIFGHPQGRSLEWSDRCTLEAADNSGQAGEFFSHQCDTEPGSSGSSVLDDATLKIVGIHDGGSANWNYGTAIANLNIAAFLPAGATSTSTTTPPTPPPTPPPTTTPPATPALSVLVGSVSATPFVMTGGLALITRESAKMNRYDGTWAEIGSLDPSPAQFDMVAYQDVVYVREDKYIHRYQAGQWDLIYDSAIGTISMAVAEGRLVIRKDSDLLAYSGTGMLFNTIGAVGAEPFRMVGSDGGLYTREGDELHRLSDGNWSLVESGIGSQTFDMAVSTTGLYTRRGTKLYFRATNATAQTQVGVVGANPFSMIAVGPALITREAGELYQYGASWTKLRDLPTNVVFDMTAAGEKLYIRLGTDLHRVGS